MLYELALQYVLRSVMKSKTISVSAIASAFVTICLTIGAYFEVADLVALVAASVFVILPLYMNSYKGCLLCYLAGGVLAFLCSGFNIMSLVFPAYFAFFGVYPIVKSKFTDVNFNKYLGFIIGLVWFVLVAYGMFFYYTAIMGRVFTDLPEWILKNVLYFLAPLAVIVFVVFDRYVLVMRRVINHYLGRIIK